MVEELREAIATQVLQAVAATISFLMLSPYSWVHGRTTAQEQASIRDVVARMITMRAADIEERCPLCSHVQCVEGCPVEVARGIVTRAGRQ